MKKINAILAASAIAVVLAGCSDAKAALPDAKTAIMTIGKTQITKGQIYHDMFASDGANIVINDATKVITSNEVEVTDDMKNQAEQTLSYYKSMYGDQFSDYLKSSGYDSEDDFLNDVLIPSLQSDELPKKYVTEFFDTLCAEYNPIQATVLRFSNEDNANAALSSLKDGSATASEAASANSSTSSGNPEIITIDTTTYDSAALSVIRSAQPDDGWTMVTSTDGGTYYVLKVDSNNPADYKDDAIDAIASLSGISKEARSYYFEKYHFHVYDIDLYNALESAGSGALVQNGNKDNPIETPSAPSASASAEASASAAAD